MELLDVTTRSGVPLRVVLIPTCEVGPNPTRKKAGQDATVEFYDRRYPHTEHGQFITDYYADHVGPYPLRLYGDEPDWQVDVDTMRLVRSWLANHGQAA